MKKSKKIIRIIGCVIVIIMASSCSLEKLTESLECDAGSLLSKANVEKTFYLEALDTYTKDKSTANCNELRTSANDFISAVTLYLDCNKQGDEATKREQKDAQKTLGDLDCQ